jgi:glycosyltransferase involved in cell wall biosynthesis
MIKLLHISGNTYPSLDGADHHTRRIWEELAAGFDEYHVLARSETNRYSYSKENNIHLHLVPKITKRSRIFFISSFFMLFLIKKYKITHLLAQCPIVGGFAAAISSNIYRIPLMVEIHGEEYFAFLKKEAFFSRLNARIMLFVFSRAKKIRSLNAEMTKKLNKFHVRGNVIEIPNRVNLNIFNTPKAQYDLHNPIRLISVGRFVKEKDYLQLIKNLQAGNVKFHLTLIGGGVLKEAIVDYVFQNKLNESIMLLDWLDQKSLVDLICNSDIYIQSSISEGMPRAILEAMALRLPIISTKVGSIEGVLTHLVNSILIESNDKNHLASAISLLISDTDLRKKIANRAYIDIIEKYEWNNVFKLYRNEIINMGYDV